MTPDAEQSMRAQLADYTKNEFIDLAISLQDVIDQHMTEKRAMQASIDGMRIQIPALQDRVDELEANEGPQADPEMEQKYIEMRTKYEELRERFDKVQALNEKFQEKLLDAV